MPAVVSNLANGCYINYINFKSQKGSFPLFFFGKCDQIRRTQFSIIFQSTFPLSLLMFFYRQYYQCGKSIQVSIKRKKIVTMTRSVSNNAAYIFGFLPFTCEFLRLKKKRSERKIDHVPLTVH